LSHSAGALCAPLFQAHALAAIAAFARPSIPEITVFLGFVFTAVSIDRERSVILRLGAGYGGADN
jgi:hypothetical protein